MLISRVVVASSNLAWLIIALAVLLSAVAVGYIGQHFAMNTDAAELISPELPWRQNQLAFAKAFPQQNNLIVVVIDGATPELAELAAGALANGLSRRSDLFQSVRRPDGGPFFSREGLLFLPLADVEATTRELIRAQPFLGPLAADPSLRGVMDSLSTVLTGVEHGQTKLDDLAHPLGRLTDVLGSIANGKPAFFSWRTTISGKPAGLRETRRFILLQPKLDNSKLTPGEPAAAAIRRLAGDLRFDPSHGVGIRLTGPVLLADDEFASLADRVGLMTTVMIVGMLIALWLAVRSFRIIACIVATTIIGLALTTALGLLIVGPYNLISVAFVPLFVGLGIDFAIQFSVRCRAERVLHPNLKTAIGEAGAKVGGSLALAAGATAIGFFAFVPTNYVGASELGLIAGVGMVLAFVLSITLLPALLTVARPTGEIEAIGLPSLAPLERFLISRRRYVLTIAGGSAVICLALLPLIVFDFNPLHLRNPKVESVSTLIDLMSNPDTTSNSIDVLAPSLDAADKLAQRLAALPEVARTMTLDSFVPNDQDAKLALIQDAASLLELTFNPVVVKAAPSDGEIAKSLTLTANALRRVGTDPTNPAAKDARRLAGILDRLAISNPAIRVQASQSLIVPFDLLLGQLRAIFQAEPVTIRNLPTDIVQDWTAQDGRARIQVIPRGNSLDNRTLERFSRAVLSVAPEASGAPIAIQEAAKMIVNAFIQAGIWSFLAITALLLVVLRNVRDVMLTLAPILLTGLLTLATCVLLGLALDFANIITLPLLFGIGVAFNIYFVIAWRSGETNLLQSSLARAVLFSALTTGTAFGNLWLSSHPGTARMGQLLLISLGWTLLVTLLFEIALLGPPRRSLTSRS